MMHMHLISVGLRLPCRTVKMHLLILMQNSQDKQKKDKAVGSTVSSKLGATGFCAWSELVTTADHELCLGFLCCKDWQAGLARGIAHNGNIARLVLIHAHKGATVAGVPWRTLHGLKGLLFLGKQRLHLWHVSSAL